VCFYISISRFLIGLQALHISLAYLLFCTYVQCYDLWARCSKSCFHDTWRLLNRQQFIYTCIYFQFSSACLFPSVHLKGVPSAESSRSVRGLGKGVSGKPYPHLCNARRPRLELGTFRSQAVRLYRLHQARPSSICSSADVKLFWSFFCFLTQNVPSPWLYL